LRSGELDWLAYAVSRFCQDSRWYSGALTDLNLLAGIKLRQERGQ
jgi:hypothetical protein